MDHVEGDLSSRTWSTCSIHSRHTLFGSNSDRFSPANSENWGLNKVPGTCTCWLWWTDEEAPLLSPGWKQQTAARYKSIFSQEYFSGVHHGRLHQQSDVTWAESWADIHRAHLDTSGQQTATVDTCSAVLTTSTQRLTVLKSACEKLVHAGNTPTLLSASCSSLPPNYRGNSKCQTVATGVPEKHGARTLPPTGDWNIPPSATIHQFY